MNRLIFFIFFIVILLPVMALAEVVIDGKPVESDIIDENITVTEDPLCMYLTEYYPAKGIESADFVPGINATGEPVVPADIGGADITPPDVMEFNISVDVAEYAGLDVPQGFENFVSVGVIRIENNRLSFNGKPLTPDSETALFEFCKDEDPAP